MEVFYKNLKGAQHHGRNKPCGISSDIYSKFSVLFRKEEFYCQD